MVAVYIQDVWIRKNAVIADKDVLLSQQNTTILEKNAVIANMTVEIVDMSATIAHLFEWFDNSVEITNGTALKDAYNALVLC
jgi:hypothetical protein